MFEEEPRRGATLLGAILLIGLVASMAAVLILFVTRWGGWAH